MLLNSFLALFDIRGEGCTRAADIELSWCVECYKTEVFILFNVLVYWLTLSIMYNASTLLNLNLCQFSLIL